MMSICSILPSLFVREVFMHVSVSTWNWAALLKEGLSYQAMLDEIKKSGFGIEFWLATMSASDIQVYEEQYKGSFACVSCHTSLANTFDDEILKSEIALCQRLGASLMVVHPCSFGFDAHTWDTHYVKAYDAKKLERVEHYIELAQRHHLLLALENGPIEILEQVMDYVESKHLGSHMGICIDTGHASMHSNEDEEYLHNLLRRFLPNLAQLHVHDNFGSADDHMIPGEGVIDWTKVLDIIGQRREDIPFVFELKGQRDPLQSAFSAKQFIENH